MKARIPRMFVTGEPTAYHVMLRKAVDRFTRETPDSDFFDKKIKERFVLRHWTDRELWYERIPFFR